MLSSLIAPMLRRRDIHYGWVVVAATFLTMIVAAGAAGAPGVFIVPLEKEFGWTTAEISSALAVRFLLFGLMGPFAATFMNRFGIRRMVLIALTIVVSGMLLSLGMSHIWQLMVLWGFVIGIGTGLTAVVLGATVAARWFTERRGLVVGMLSASSATGQLIFLPSLAAATQAYGWRIALLGVVGMMVVAAIGVVLLMRDRPADLGLAPYGETQIVPTPAIQGGLGTLLVSPLKALVEASGSWTFWALFLTFFVCGLSTNGLIQTHFVSLCGDYGLAPVAAAGVLAMMGFFDFFGTVGSGWLSDRYDNRWLLFWYYGLRGLSLIYLPFTDFSVYGLTIFAVFYGLDWLATVPPTVKLAAQRFGREKVNVIFGWVFAGHQTGSAIAAYGAGLTRTEYQSYLPAFFGAGLVCLAAAMLALTIGRIGRARPIPAAA